jgi:hypothetical protein
MFFQILIHAFFTGFDSEWSGYTTGITESSINQRPMEVIPKPTKKHSIGFSLSSVGRWTT